MITYHVMLNDGTSGRLDSDTINGQSADAFIGEIVRIKARDDEGYTLEVEGMLIEVFSAN